MRPAAHLCIQGSNSLQDKVVHVRASVRLLTTADGGRSGPIKGSYRPNHNFFGPDDTNMAIGFVDVPNAAELKPGESAELQIAFWSWPELEGQIYPGRQWRIQEGGKLVGIGTVLVSRFAIADQEVMQPWFR